MEVKTYLQEIRNERLEIRQYEERITELRMSLLPGAIRYDKPNVQTSPDDQMLKIEARIDEIESSMKAKLEALVNRYNNAVKYIGMLDSSSHRMVLYEYYLNAERPSWEQVARRLDYSVDRVYQLHREAINKLNDIIGDISNGTTE